MTNFEFYKNEILGIGDITEISLTKTGKIVNCHNLDCSNCQFNYFSCLETKTRWLYEEHVEKPKLPKLTKKERLFCELIKTGFLFREKNNELYWSPTMPTKINIDDDWNYNYIVIPVSRCFDELKFDFIEKEHMMAAKIERLLEFGVEE